MSAVGFIEVEAYIYAWEQFSQNNLQNQCVPQQQWRAVYCIAVRLVYSKLVRRKGGRGRIRRSHCLLGHVCSHRDLLRYRSSFLRIFAHIHGVFPLSPCATRIVFAYSDPFSKPTCPTLRPRDKSKRTWHRCAAQPRATWSACAGVCLIRPPSPLKSRAGAL